LLVSNFDENKGIHLVQRTTAVNIKVSGLNNESQEALGRNNESSHSWLHDNLRLRLHNYLRLGLHKHLRLGLHNYLRLGLNDDSGTATHSSSHTNELRSHTDPATITQLDDFLTGTMLSKDIEGNVGLADDLHWVTLVLDNNVHIMLEHVCLNFHELESPSGFFSTMVRWLGAEVLLANSDVANW